jgi:hypothetical protein
MATKLGRKQLLELGLAGLGVHALALIGCGDDTSAGEDDDGAGASGGGGAGAAGGEGGSGAAAGQGGQPQGGQGGDGGGTGGSGPGMCTALIVAEISLNHPQPHELQIPLEDVVAGVEATYQTSGPSGHCHEVTVTAADFATLQNGGSVTLVSCNGGDHEYVLSCVAGAPPPGDPMCEGTDQTGSC